MKFVQACNLALATRKFNNNIEVCIYKIALKLGWTVHGKIATGIDNDVQGGGYLLTS
jgi:hypothetical protein